MNTIDAFEPLADQIVIEPLRKLEHFETRTASGLFLADNPERDKQREVFRLGRVVKCGPGDAVREGKVREDGSRAAYQAPDGRWPIHVQAGDIILYERRPWAVIEIYDPQCNIVRHYEVLHEEQHIVAVLEDYTGPVEPLAFDPKGRDLVA